MGTVCKISPLLALCMLAGTAQADPCADIIQDTIAELRAGAGALWSEEAEGIARAAAGSACIKATSGRYATKAESTEESTEMSVASDGAQEGKTEEASDGSWSVGGLTFRGMSGAPSKKPYQRERVDGDKSNDQDNE